MNDEDIDYVFDDNDFDNEISDEENEETNPLDFSKMESRKRAAWRDIEQYWEMRELNKQIEDDIYGDYESHDQFLDYD